MAQGLTPRSAWWTRFRLSSGETVLPHDFIVPILEQRGPTEYRVLASAFYVNDLAFLTAKHVYGLDDADDGSLVPRDFDQVLGYFVPHFQTTGEEVRAILRPVVAAGALARGDVGIGFVGMPEFASQTEPPPAVRPQVTRRWPPVGEAVHVFGYPRTVVIAEDESTITVKLAPTKASGMVVEHRPEGRDSAMLPGECFAVETFFDNGMSGAPVFDQKGRVCGIASTAMTGQGVAWITPVSTIVDLPILSQWIRELRLSQTSIQTIGDLLDVAAD